MNKIDIWLKGIIRKIPWKLVIFAVLIVNALYWCAKKEGYYIDELWSYGLSNSYYSPFLMPLFTIIRKMTFIPPVIICSCTRSVLCFQAVFQNGLG